MALGARYVQGNSDLKQPITVATAQYIERMDMTALVSNTLIRASDFTWTTDLATTQTAFALVFAGVSLQRKCSATGLNQAFFGQNERVYGNSEDNTIMVCHGGIFEFDTVARVYNVGDFVGPAKDTGNTLLKEQVINVSGIALAIGRVVKKTLSTDTKVMVDIFSSLNVVS